MNTSASAAATSAHNKMVGEVSGDPCTGVPSNQFTHMGYTMRTAEWRYTEWLQWRCFDANNCTGAAQWSDEAPKELYSHIGDAGDCFDCFELENVAYDPANAQLVAQLSQRLRAGWQHALPEGYRFPGELDSAA